MGELKEIMSNLSDKQIIDIMMELGADRYTKTGGAIVFPTICHNYNAAESSMKLYYYPKTKTFHCYTDCACTFNIIEMFKKRYELLGINYDFYRDIVLKIGGGRAKRQKESFYKPYESIYNNAAKNLKVDMPPLNKGILNAFNFYPTQEWLSDGISEQAMKDYNILYSISDNKIIIPHYDMMGNLVGVRGRALNEEDLAIGKYMPVKLEGKIYNHPLGYNLYGLNLVKDNIKKYGIAIVAEAEKSCLQYSTMFGQNKNIVVATCGSAFHKHQLDLLLECGAKRILLAFDKEGESAKEQDKYYYKLKNICLKYKNYCNMGFIWDATGLLRLKDSPFDRGSEVTKELISKGVWLN